MLDFFISSAEAQTAGGQAGGGMDYFGLIMFGGLFVIMYFMLIRPQRKRQKEHDALIGGLNKGDEVVMTSGILGKITSLTEGYISIDTGTVELTFQRAAVHAVLPKGTIKSIK